MIRVERRQQDPNGRPIRPSDAWFTRAVAAADQALQDGAGHEADANIYAAGQVRRALEALFHGKCAYCETKTARWSWEVEHFRPKGRVHERADHPGYYWLSYDWLNLFPSCERCNQRRLAQPTWSGAPGIAGGKANQFPLTNEGTRVMAAPPRGTDLRAGLAAEARHILDPCEDEPEDHLAFDSLGQAYPIAGSAKGDKTIEVFNLNEARVVNERRDLVDQVVQVIEKYLEANDGRMSKAEIIDQVVEIFGDASSEYAAAIRSIKKDPASFGLRT